VRREEAGAVLFEGVVETELSVLRRIKQDLERRC
jgi:hypothetical protein